VSATRSKLRRICALHGPESHTTGRYLVEAARRAGHVVDVRANDRHIGSGNRYDMLLYVDPGPPVFPLDLDQAAPVRVAYLIDVHQEITSRLQLAPLFDVIFLAQRDYVEEFRKRGFANTHWLPLACDPELHTVPSPQRDIDVGFVGKLGSAGSWRRGVLEQVLSAFNTNDYRAFYSPAQMGALYGRSKVVVNASINGDVNMRVFEALAAGAVLVTDRIENGLSDLFIEGEHYVGYSTADEAVERIAHLLAHPPERERIAAAGQALAIEAHTYDRRWQVIDGAVDEVKLNGARKDGRPTHRDRTYARILETRRDPRGILRLMGRSGLDLGIGASLLRATVRAVNVRVPLTPNAWRARLRNS
jgi:glycosyltransferase involved in cell wall biosynthesis